MIYDEKMESMTRKPWNGERGFTLIELMVIVVVIGILASITISLYLRWRSKTTGADVTGGIRTHVDPFDAGYDQFTFPSPKPSFSPTLSPDTLPAFKTPTMISPMPAGVEPRHEGPMDNG